MIGKLDSYLGFNEAALKLRGYRQEVLASNLANADTPHYKARDFKFADALTAAVGRDNSLNMSMKQTNGRHLQGSGANPLQPRLMFRNESQPSIDGNTVESDVEMAQFSDNAIRYQAEIQFLTSKINGLRSALQSQ